MAVSPFRILNSTLTTERETLKIVTRSTHYHNYNKSYKNKPPTSIKEKILKAKPHLPWEHKNTSNCKLIEFLPQLVLEFNFILKFVNTALWMQLGCATSSLTFSHEKIMIISLKIDPSAVAVLGKVSDIATFFPGAVYQTLYYFCAWMWNKIIIKKLKRFLMDFLK